MQGLKDISVPIFIQEYAGIQRTNEPVRIGVPFPRGVIEDTACLKLKSRGGTALPLQVRVMDHWPDKSLKWALLDFAADVGAGSQEVFTLVNDLGQASRESDTSSTISISETPKTFVVNTGAATFTLARDGLGLPSSVSIDGVKILSGSEISLKGDGKRQLTVKSNSLAVEESGLLRCTFRLEGKFVQVRNKDFCNFRARLTFFAGLATAALEFDVHNPRAALHPGGLWDLGDPASMFLDDLSYFPPGGFTSGY